MSIVVPLTPDLRTVALDWLIESNVSSAEFSRLGFAFVKADDGMILRTDYRIEADMIVTIAEALRYRAYQD